MRKPFACGSKRWTTGSVPWRTDVSECGQLFEQVRRLLQHGGEPVGFYGGDKNPSSILRCLMRRSPEGEHQHQTLAIEVGVLCDVVNDLVPPQEPILLANLGLVA